MNTNNAANRRSRAMLFMRCLFRAFPTNWRFPIHGALEEFYDVEQLDLHSRPPSRELRKESAMSFSRFAMKASAAFLVASLLQLVLPSAASAQWHSNVPDQKKGNDQIVTVVVAGALLTGGIIAYQKYLKQRRERPRLALVTSPTAVGLTQLYATDPPPNPEAPKVATWQPKLLVDWDPGRRSTSLRLRWSF